MFNIIEYNNIEFMICEEPNFFNINKLILEFKKHTVNNIITCIESKILEIIKISIPNIKIHNLIFEDGGFPSSEILRKWISILINLKFLGKIRIAIMCKSGLGRSPLLICLALIKIFKFDPAESIIFVRKKIRGALNKKQVEYILNYKKSSSLSFLIKNFYNNLTPRFSSKNL